MDDPVKEIPAIIHSLTQDPPAQQQRTLRRYFIPDAAFIHPFCRTGKSRELIGYIYLWYKILSPTIELTVDSVAFDHENLILYVSLHQVFSIWLLPFHHARANLTTVLKLTKLIPSPERSTLGLPPQPVSRPKYYIVEQNDLYQTNEFVKFVLPWLNLATYAVNIWQFFATLACVAGTFLLYPIVWLEDQGYVGGNHEREVAPRSDQGLGEARVSKKI